jgi:prefoldin subunit 5
MSNRQLSLREKTKSALERIGSIEDNFDNLTQSLERELGKMQRQLANLEESLTAVIQSIGKDVVDALIEDSRKARKEAETVKAKEEITNLVSQKILVPTDVVGEDSFIVGHDVDAEGAVVHPGFGHVHFKQVDPKFQEKVKGLKVGDAIPTGAEGTKQAFVIDTIYTFVPPQPEPEVAAQVEQAAEPKNMEMSATLHPVEGSVKN